MCYLSLHVCVILPFDCIVADAESIDISDVQVNSHNTYILFVSFLSNNSHQAICSFVLIGQATAYLEPFESTFQR